MMPFAGYTMPVRYEHGIIREHNHCRNLAGFFDISHMGQFLISGKSAALELEKLVPSNITGLKNGQLRYTVLTNNKGGIIDDIIVSLTEHGFLVVVNASCKEKDFNHFNEHLSVECEIQPLPNRALFAVQGPASAKIMAQLSESAAQLSFMHACNAEIAGLACYISRCGYTGEDGFEISIEQQHAETLARLLLGFKEITPIGLGARDTLRLEAGLSLYGHELDETISPVEAGLKWILRKPATGYLGCQIIQSQLNKGVSRSRVGLIVNGKLSLRKDCLLYNSDNNKIGVITSGSYAPNLKCPIAMALIDSQHKEPLVYAIVRNQQIAASITSLPFISHRYLRSS